MVGNHALAILFHQIVGAQHQFASFTRSVELCNDILAASFWCSGFASLGIFCGGGIELWLVLLLC